MKMNTRDFNELQGTIGDFIKRIESGIGLEAFRKQYRDKGLSPMRFRWDIFHGATDAADANTFGTPANQWRRRTNKYLNDDNIDTALRKICPAL